MLIRLSLVNVASATLRWRAHSRERFFTGFNLPDSNASRISFSSASSLLIGFTQVLSGGLAAWNGGDSRGIQSRIF